MFNPGLAILTAPFVHLSSSVYPCPATWAHKGLLSPLQEPCCLPSCHKASTSLIIVLGTPLTSPSEPGCDSLPFLHPNSLSNNLGGGGLGFTVSDISATGPLVYVLRVYGRYFTAVSSSEKTLQFGENFLKQNVKGEVKQDSQRGDKTLHPQRSSLRQEVNNSE